MAEIIDVVIVAVIANVLLVMVGAHPWWHMYHAHVVRGSVIAKETTLVLAALLYYPIFMLRTDGQTVGKMTLNIRVVRTDRKSMSMGRAAWREVALKFVLLGLVGVLPLVGLILSEICFWADGMWPLWDGESRALHDMLAGTRVVLA